MIFEIYGNKTYLEEIFPSILTPYIFKVKPLEYMDLMKYSALSNIKNYSLKSYLLVPQM